ncbi:MAG TPA: nuclear transport factor 2 family protein [Nevskiaceae bacterium]|nr:nuclear transport factor 2 family protein [Nevskiaceae bacterium]
MSARQQANLELAQRFYEAIFSADLPFMRAHVTDDFCVVEADGLPYGGTWKGLDGFQRLFAKITDEVFEGVDIQLQSIAANDTHAMSFFRFTGTARKTGRRVDFDIAEVVTIRDGKVACIKPFYFDTKAVAAACTP